MTTTTTTTTTTLQHRSINKAVASTPLPATTSTRAPTTPLPFTVADLRRAIPAHCFQHSLRTSFTYLAADIVLAIVLYIVSTYIDTIFTTQRFGSFTSFILRHICWSVYWFAQGVVFTGLWVLGHECGHGGFASSNLVNDVVGFIIHSFLLVPYFSWKISHRRHHANTGSLEHDEVFVPDIISEDQQEKYRQSIQHEDEENYFVQLKCFVVRVCNILFMLTFGWMAYLILNVTSNKSYNPNTFVTHFLPSSPLFNEREKILVLLSDIGMLAQICVLIYLCQLTSLSHIIYSYILPYVINVGFLVLITFLQHTSLSLPHYSSLQWEWLRGALLTVDRSFGVLNIFLHHITDTHVCHHVFSSMPFYHAQEATEAIKNRIGSYYQKDDTPVLQALYHSYKHCYGVAQDASQPGVYWF